MSNLAGLKMVEGCTDQAAESCPGIDVTPPVRFKGVEVGKCGSCEMVLM